MKRMIPMVLLLAFATAMAFGCAGDVVKQALATPEMQGKVMDMIGADPAMAGPMLDKLLAGEGKTMVMEKLLANTDAAQALIGKVAADPEMVDKVLSMAVQDSVMKSHVVGFMKGLQAAKKK